MIKDMNKSPRWFIRSHGHTLGPLTWQELEASLLSGDYGEETKVSSDHDQTWVSLFERNELKPLLLSRELQKVTLKAPPSPSIFFSKKTPAIEPKAKPIDLEKKEETGPLLENISSKKVDLPERPAFNFSSSPGNSSDQSFHDPLLEILRDVRAADRIEANQSTQKKDEVDLSQISFLTNKEEKRRIENIEPPPAHNWNTYQEPKIFELRVKISKQTLWILAALLIACAAYFGFSSLGKMRDLKETNLSDPPSPTIQPSEESDPLPPLKAPTRPQRD